MTVVFTVELSQISHDPVNFSNPPPLIFLQTSSPNSSNENSPVSPPDEPGQGDGTPQLEEEEPAFPHTDLAKLDDMINRYFGVATLFL